MAPGNPDDLYEYHLLKLAVVNGKVSFTAIAESDTNFSYRFVGIGRGDKPGGLLEGTVQVSRNGKLGQSWKTRFYKFPKGTYFGYIATVNEKIDSVISINRK